MNLSSGVTERRHYKRYQVQNGIVAFPMSASVIIGTIIDISRGGLAVRYASETQKVTDNIDIDILLADQNYYMTKIPIHTVTDFELINTAPFSLTNQRRCGVQFGELSSNQENQLEDILLNHTIEADSIP